MEILIVNKMESKLKKFKVKKIKQDKKFKKMNNRKV